MAREQPPGPGLPDGWTAGERRLLSRFRDPMDVQSFLSRIEYDPEQECRSPRWVMREMRAHCFEGALFAAAALRSLGHPPILLDLRAENDDDHVIAVFRERGCWGAVAKSNFTTLRFRESVYRTLRELAMSYFEVYFNTLGEKTLRERSLPFDLSRYDARRWMTTDEDLEYIGDALDGSRHVRLLTPSQERSLRATDPALMEAGLLGSKPEGLYKPSRG
jgi:hypothetical protein